MSALGEMAARVSAGSTLGRAEAAGAMREILSGDARDADIAGFLSSLAARGEATDELEGMLDVMMERSVGVALSGPDAIDVCGTGGDGAHTFNVSTAAAFVAAAAGATVAKHGNRSSSGGVGSADIFASLGMDLDSAPDTVATAIETCGIGFMFAPKFHPAMRAAAAARKMISGTRTALNLLGPLANPARVNRQLVGVSSSLHLDMLPEILARRGSACAMAVRSANGLDELSTVSDGTAVIARNGAVKRVAISPSGLGLRESGLGDLRVEGARDALAAVIGAIDGSARRAMVETAALNAGAALVVADRAAGIAEGLEMAMSSIRSGGASKKLDEFVAMCGKPALLEEARRA